MLNQNFGRMCALILCCACIFTATTTAFARELFVDRNSYGGQCSDNYLRTEVSESRPWCTLGPAGIYARAGDRVTVREGVYGEVQSCHECNDRAVLQVINGGSPSALLRFRAADGERVIIDGGRGTYHGIQIIKTHLGNVPRYVQVTGFEVRGFRYGTCVDVADTSNVIISEMDVYKCNGSGVAFRCERLEQGSRSAAMVRVPTDTRIFPVVIEVVAKQGDLCRCCFRDINEQAENLLHAYILELQKRKIRQNHGHD